jgi:hypothetical protein
MPETTFHIPSLTDQDAADAVMFVLHDLPCIHQADVNLPERSAWVSHSTMIAAEDIATAWPTPALRRRCAGSANRQRPGATNGPERVKRTD